MDVSVIIVNYRTKELVRDCLQSVEEQTKDIQYEVIVVDNASEDITDLASDGVRIVQLEDNLGFGGANNVGARIASGDVLFFLNPDTIILNNAIKILYDALTGISRCGVVGANLYDADLKPVHSYYYCTMTLKHAFRSMLCPSGRLHHVSRQHNFSDVPKKVAYITGADLMMRKDLFEEIGGYNDDIFMYYEDVDLCSRVRKKRLFCFSIPQARIQHLEGQSFKPSQQRRDEVMARKRRMSGDSIAVFLKSNYSAMHYKAIIVANISILRLKKIFTKVVSGNSTGIEQQLEFFKYIKRHL